MYVQGMSTSMPIDVQYAFLRTIPGFEDVKMMRPAYAIEYDLLDPLQLYPTLEVIKLPGLYSAGQSMVRAVTKRPLPGPCGGDQCRSQNTGRRTFHPRQA